jgi:hypothetical protein
MQVKREHGYGKGAVGFLVGYGLLPFWAACAVVLRDGGYGTGAEGWVFLLGLMFSSGTLLIAGITLRIHAEVSGDPFHKKVVATTWFLVFNALPGLWWLREESFDRVMDFVRSHETVVQQYGPHVNLLVSDSTMNIWTGRLEKKYAVAISASDLRQRGFAIVSVKIAAGQRQFALDCITPPPTSLDDPDPFKFPCKQ